MDSKRCAGCGLTKPVTAFHRDHDSTDGYRSRCKECRKPESKIWYRENAETIKARTKAWQEANPERYAQQLWKWAQKPGNLERKRANDRAYYRAHRAEAKAYSEQPEVRVKARLNAKNQKAKRKRQIGATIHPITAAEWEGLKAQYAGCCAYCGKLEPEPTMDHVVPLIKGGDHTVDNIVPACGPCNLEKNDRSVVEFLRTRRTSC